jgi:23S rRNA (cytidine1920-2'-O)/16S rRNA (cytidine1409-2'-O)-methyltransferase
VAKRARVDELLTIRGMAPSIERARALVMAGRVFSGEARVDKPGTPLLLDAPLAVRGDDNPYVSRGGLKLASALTELAAHGLHVAGKVAVDIGASTGGFTDCLLQAGATRVYAVDVGYGLLHARLRDDPRVIVRERTNARALGAEDFPEPIALVTVDASFIALGALAPAIARILPQGAELCALVKPQFEADRAIVSRGKGVVRDAAERQTAITSASSDVEAEGFTLIASCDSAVAGPKGNRESFLYAVRR